ncbi:hypothetical protein AB1Y20_023397 [Prymnesium parvum]|uniref:Uncharacterized protein n=1 Tax=Prymnesium parvum TaxID=97485 RepID=A0AB34JG40_PRYPA
MPTRPFRAADLDDAQFCIAAARVLQSADDEDADDMAGLLLFAAAEPLMRSIRQEIGNEHLSVESIRRDAAAQGFGGDVFSANIYDRRRLPPRRAGDCGGEASSSACGAH